jgi:hypothetical protein
LQDAEYSAGVMKPSVSVWTLKRIGKQVDMTAAEVSASPKRIPQRGPLVTHVRDRRPDPEHRESI